jgi:hypothetical protein
MTRKEEDRTRTPAPMITNYGCPTSVWVFWVGFLGWVSGLGSARDMHDETVVHLGKSIKLRYA